MAENQTGQPMGAPTPKRRAAPWVWVLVGMFVTVVIAAGLFGAFVLGRQAGQLPQVLTESTATVPAESTVAPGGMPTGEGVGGTGGGMTGGGSTGGGSTGGETGGGGSTGGETGGGETGGGAVEETPTGSGGAGTTTEEYRSILKQEGTGPFTSSAIPVGQGSLRLTVWVTRTTGRAMRARYQMAGGPLTTWWTTANAIDGQTRTVTIPVTAARAYRFQIECEPMCGWALRVQWRP